MVDFDDNQMFSFVAPTPTCPSCKKEGDLVPNTVLRSNVKIQNKDKINLNTDNYICMNPDCNVAYYNSNGTIHKDELKRELWYKTGTERVIACYCNNIDTEQLKDAVVNHNLSSWKEICGHYRVKVIEKCEILNPTGLCCRKTFRSMVEEVKISL